LADRVDQLRRRMLVRRDQLYTSTLTVGEVLAKPIRQQRLELVDQYLAFFRRSAMTLLAFDLKAAQFYGRIRSDLTIRPPDAIQLACAASADMDLFITHDAQLSQKVVPGISFVTGLERAPI
jgi:uncharacterized protein